MLRVSGVMMLILGTGVGILQVGTEFIVGSGR